MIHYHLQYCLVLVTARLTLGREAGAVRVGRAFSFLADFQRERRRRRWVEKHTEKKKPRYGQYGLVD